MENQLTLTAFFISFGLAAGAHSSNQVGANTFSNEANEGVQNFRNLFDSIKKNDGEKTEIYRNIMRQEAGKERQAFDSMKEHLRPARQRTTYRQENVHNSNIGEKAAPIKREAGKNEGHGVSPSEVKASTMSFSFEHKRVLITGAGRGIGQSTVKAFVRAKAAKVFAVSRTKSYLDQLVAEEPSVIPIAVDLTDMEAAKKALGNIGPIDILINNAGCCNMQNFFKITPEDYKKEFDTNFQSVVTVSQIVLKDMVERKQGGCVVNLSSRMSLRSNTNYSLYSASKAAVDSLTRTMAVEFGPHNIRVNSINPGVVRTDMAKHVHGDEDILVKYCSRIPLGRVCDVDDIVNVILFLASDASRMINGHSLPVDGGNLIMA